ncbi:MAG: dTDP-4-dehydrorhamnose 3,5-epimerase [Flavitalea sp.]
MITFLPTPLPGSFSISTEPFSDTRGWFERYFCKEEFSKIGHEKEWVQMNHSVSLRKGTIRGMHFQVPPHGEVKLVKCIRGSVYDVIIDIRAGSATFLQWFGIELSDENRQMLYIPEGFAHGFQCLSDHCELLYHHTSYYVPGSEGGIRYNDHLINIGWPLPRTMLSERDAAHPLLDKNFKGI